MDNEQENWIEVSGETATLAHRLAEQKGMAVERVISLAIREYTNRLIAEGLIPPLNS